MASYRPALCQACHIDNPAPFAFQMGSHTYNAPMVTTPVPPTPVKTILIGSASEKTAAERQVCFSFGLQVFQLAALDANKAGAEPLIQEKSLLQAD